jgi:hypothetical protein
VRKKLAVLVTMLLMLAMMIPMAMPAFARGGAAGKCGPPGQGVRVYAKTPGESVPRAYGGPPEGAVSDVCAPGQM